MSSYHHRKIYEQHKGPIPKDEDGKSFEIHHKDGNRENNQIDNLLCVTIKEHYKIHYEQGDFGACVLIAKRMNLPPDHISKIQSGKKRPGIGGVKKGTIPWNKNKSGYSIALTEEGRIKKTIATKRNARINDIDANKIRQDFEQNVKIHNDKIGLVQKNGKKYTYENAFMVEYAKKFNVTPQYIYRILRGKSKIV
jgi:hypothetical protein